SNPHGAYATSSRKRWKPRHRSNQRLANGDHVRFRKQTPEPFPILFVRQRINVGSHRLVHVHTQRSAKLFGYSRDRRQPQVVRLHHDRDDGYRHTEPYATFCLPVDQLPIAVSALCILFRLRRVIERKLDVVKGAQFVVFQNSNTMAVGSDGELDGLCAQIGQYRFKLWMHSVLTGTQIHRTDRQSFHDGLHLIQREAISAGWISVAEGAVEVALVGEPEPKRNRGIRRPRAGWDG